MSDRANAAEPSMEDILASIRRIIDEEDAREEQQTRNTHLRAVDDSEEKPAESAAPESEAATTGNDEDVFPQRRGQRWTRATGRNPDIFVRAQNSLDAAQDDARDTIDSLTSDEDDDGSTDSRLDAIGADVVELTERARAAKSAQDDSGVLELTDTLDRDETEADEAFTAAEGPEWVRVGSDEEPPARVGATEDDEFFSAFDTPARHADTDVDPAELGGNAERLATAGTVEDTEPTVELTERLDAVGETFDSAADEGAAFLDDAGEAAAESAADAAETVADIADEMDDRVDATQGAFASAVDELSEEGAAASERVSETVEDVADAATDAASEAVESVDFTGSVEAATPDGPLDLTEKLDPAMPDFASDTEVHDLDNAEAVAAIADDAEIPSHEEPAAKLDDIAGETPDWDTPEPESDNSYAEAAYEAVADTPDDVEEAVADADWETDLDSAIADEEAEQEPLAFADNFDASDVYHDEPPALDGDYRESLESAVTDSALGAGVAAAATAAAAAASVAGGERVRTEEEEAPHAPLREAPEPETEPRVQVRTDAHPDPAALVSMTSEEMSARALASLADPEGAASRKVYGALRITEDRASDSIEGVVKDLLRPMLREWLDDNLPTMVEGMVRSEVERISAKARRYRAPED